MRIINLTCSYQNIVLKNFLKKELNISSSLTSKLKNSNGILVNGTPVTVRTLLCYGDVITLEIPHVAQPVILPVKHSLSVLYEDEDVICVNKPFGVPTHPSHGHETDTLANFVAYRNIGTDNEFHAVTRLDSYTSGVVIIAKNLLSASKMCFKEYNSETEKYYTALCRGIIEGDGGIIEAPISRCNDSVIKRCVSEKGKYSKTEYKVVSTVSGNTIVQLTLHTGRTHQIRVHMSHIGHPLLNDFLYDDNALESKHHLLHCHKVVFNHPLTYKRIEVNAPMPTELLQ